MFIESFLGFESDRLKKEKENQRQERRAEIMRKLEAIDLTLTTIEKLTPEEVMALDDEVYELARDLEEESRPERDKKIIEYSKPAKKRLKEPNEERKNKMREFFYEIFDNVYTGCVVAEKTREYDTKHWEEALRDKLAKAETPFGSARDSLVSFYKEKGIDIENPGPSDIKAFLERRDYTGGNIEKELKRRTDKKIPLERQERSHVYELFWGLFQRVDKEGKLETLVDRELKKAMLKLRPQIESLDIKQIEDLNDK